LLLIFIIIYDVLINIWYILVEIELFDLVWHPFSLSDLVIYNNSIPEMIKCNLSFKNILLDYVLHKSLYISNVNSKYTLDQIIDAIEYVLITAFHGDL
jgi:hypothetical protein